MKRSVFVFSDLDDTLFQTQRKCIQADSLIEAAVDRAGQPLSFHSPEQVLLLQILRPYTLIPVTGRNLSALERIRSPSFESYRITSHGALVWHAGGGLVPVWKRQVEREAAVWEPRMQRLLKIIETHRRAERAEALRFRIVYDAGMPVYLSVKGSPDSLLRLEKTLYPVWSREMGAIIHRNDQNMSLLPPYADKAKAVDYVMNLIRARCETSPLFIGIGDSVTDIAFLKACHYALTPRHSQIHREVWTLPGAGASTPAQ